MKKLSIFSRIFLSVLMLLSSAPIKADAALFVCCLFFANIISEYYGKKPNQNQVQEQSSGISPISSKIEETITVAPSKTEEAITVVPSTKKEIFFVKLDDAKNFVKANPVKTTVVLVGGGLLVREVYKNRKKIKKDIVGVASVVATGTTDTYKIIKAKIVKA